MNLTDRITVELGKCGGRPCIRGTRFRVMDLLELLASGATNEEILRDYEFLQAEDIPAALLYAARQTDEDFFDLVNRKDETGRLLWVRMGNCRTSDLLVRFKSVWPEIQQAFDGENRVVILP